MHMGKLTIAALALTLVATPASAMNVAEFLAKAKTLQARGMLAIFSSDYKLLKNEMLGIGAQYRADVEGAKAAGRAPHSCPPPRGKAKMTPEELLADLERIPVAQRGMSMKAAFYAIMQRRYPCR